MTLNTIIEEEKKEFDSTFTLNNVGCSECSGTELLDKREVPYPKGEYHCEWDLEKIKDFLTTAIQRAYEAGQSEEREQVKEMVEGMKDEPLDGWEGDYGYNLALDTVLAKLTENKTTE